MYFIICYNLGLNKHTKSNRKLDQRTPSDVTLAKCIDIGDNRCISMCIFESMTSAKWLDTDISRTFGDLYIG